MELKLLVTSIAYWGNNFLNLTLSQVKIPELLLTYVAHSNGF